MLYCLFTDFRARFSFKISMKVGERLFSLSHMVTRLSLFLMLPVGFRIEVVCFGEGIGELRIDTCRTEGLQA